jgi:hypothetical protein
MAPRGAREGAVLPSLHRYLAGCRRVLRQWRTLVGTGPRSVAVEPLLDDMERELDMLGRKAERLEALVRDELEHQEEQG